jgi:hypothetical protein
VPLADIASFDHHVPPLPIAGNQAANWLHNLRMPAKDRKRTEYPLRRGEQQNREFVRENREFEPGVVQSDFRMTFSEETGAQLIFFGHSLIGS